MPSSERSFACCAKYGLIIAVVVIAMIAGLTALADSTTGIWGDVSTKVEAAH
jgi:pilus assembly protein Flp/PilA